jgi:uncharacterized repeat protein (TIGR03943 family)
MNARTQSFVLLLFGGALLRLATSDALLRFVRPVARPWVLLAGAAIVTLALTNLLPFNRRGDDHLGATRDAHGHTSAPRAAWLVLAPVVAILVIAPPALGSYSAARVPVAFAKPSVMHFPALAAGNPVAEHLTDFAARALWDSGRTLTGRRVALTGFVLRGAPGGFVLTRLVITCCAADARPIDIGVRSGDPTLAADTWVTVVGTYTGVSPTDSTLPLIDATSVTVIPPPTNPYDD